MDEKSRRKERGAPASDRLPDFFEWNHLQR
jgi:hypothetical protein